MSCQTKFELSLLEELLLHSLHPTRIENTLKTKSAEVLNIEIGQEVFRIIGIFRNLACSNFEEYLMERYIQTHQREAIRLLGVLQQHLNAGLNDSCNSIYAAFTTAIERILTYIEKELSKYFDLSLVVPDSYRRVSIELLRESGLVLTAKLKSRDIDGPLQQIIVSYINNYCTTGICTYSNWFMPSCLWRTCCCC
ncbi:hypothetical protein HDC92_005084 [Pedobacter sp. AK017]|uniref:hypothetical protein n=1 Tax=Pedobacter sp. AK017 TaxID=2723073 RepID=UPI0016091E70|nr:hypothetical protein [Pedobacter sp. AK017]MBB5441376.1 hypothetical protein [Pedobacter sp. AK017]